jgi:hypothetical protein
MPSRTLLDGKGSMGVDRQKACQRTTNVVDVQQGQTTRDHVQFTDRLILFMWTLQQVDLFYSCGLYSKSQNIVQLGASSIFF